MTDYYEELTRIFGDFITNKEGEAVSKQLYNRYLDWLDPKLNPFHYEDLGVEEMTIGTLATLGLLKLPKAASTFVVGKSLATTKGVVLFENEVMQLLYYPGEKKPKYQKPVLIVPPWINKYYIFDLAADKSMIKWLIDQDIPTYCISWVNADKSFSELRFDDYIQTGIQCAIHEVLHHWGVDHVNALGYCIGGVALAVAAPLLADKLASVTFLATPFDFTQLNNLNQFITPLQIKSLEKLIKQEGVYHGERMLSLFSQLRAHEMIYQDIINRVYLKKQPVVLDYLHWNADVTNIPGCLHLDYLKEIYVKNYFMVNKEKVSLCNPVYILSALKDHIVPTSASFEGRLLYENQTFCIADGGHVAGIIHSPHRKKYGHWHPPPCKSTSLTQWHAAAQYEAESWWHHWRRWLEPHLGDKKSPYKGASRKAEKAPGRYALQEVQPHPGLYPL